MTVTLPDKFLLEYWNQPREKRKLLVPSSLSILQSQGEAAVKDWMANEGWSTEFVDWILPRIENFRSDLELDALPSVPNLDRDQAAYTRWLQLKEKTLKTARIAAFCVVAGFLTSQVVSGSMRSFSDAKDAIDLIGMVNIFSLIALEVFMWFILKAKGRAPLFSLCGLIAHLIFVVPDLEFGLRAIVYFGFWIITGVLMLIFFLIPDVNKQVEPKMSEEDRQRLGLLEQIQVIRSREEG